MLKKIETTIFAALVAVCASPGFAAKVTFNGAEIEYTKATVSYPDGEGGDIVFKFANAAEAGELKLPSYAQAWILSVGGGGAGGCAAAEDNDVANGAGGGGGGGGFVEVRDVVLNGGTYQITVGAGGATNVTGVAASGGNGQPSMVKTNGVAISAFTAGGGGGGGSKGPGASGASGGGGSKANGAAQAGGAVASAFSGQGNAGGSGTEGLASGGGGGAGEAGAQTSGVEVSGNGGRGRSSKIELSSSASDSEAIFYAGGGGGGAFTSVLVGAGGIGGGGSGGGGRKGTSVSAVAGENGKGGGGGGGSHKQSGAAGGSGVVIIRISEALVSDPVRPSVTQEKIYTGEALYAVKPSLALALTGDYCATNVGLYTCSAKPKDGFTWQGGGTEEISVSWQILPRKVQYPVAIPTAAYDGENRVAIDSPDEALVFESGSVTNATDAGTYTYTVSLKSDNYVWDGAEAGHERDPHTVQWTISSQRVSVPAVLTGHVYDGTEKTAVDLSAAAFNSNAYRFVESPAYTHKETNASNYHFAVQLNNTASASNYVWFIDGAETYVNQERAWSIAKAPNSIKTLEISGWKVSPSAVGETPKATSTWGTPQFSFAKSEDAIESEWSPWTTTDKPDETGIWWVRARVEEDVNWLGAERKMSFVLWDNPASLFSDSIELAIANYSGTTALENFPLLVRISEASMPGFKYERAGMNGEEIAFICGDEMLDYDVDTWDVTGESLVWVKIPRLEGNSTKISMWWHLRDGQETSGSRKERVWADYYGVWHFNEEIVASAAGTTKSVDATGNGYDANPKNYGTASWINEMISKDGIVGRARQITSTKRSKGPRLEIENSASLTLGTGFTMSGWFKEPSSPDLGNNHNTKVLASRKTAANNTNGWLIEIYPSSTANQQDRRITGQGAGSTGVQATVLGTTAKRFYERGWAYFSGSYNGTTLGVAGGSSTDAYARGSASNAQAPTDNGQVISLGGFVGGTQDIQSFFGVFDEFRLCKLPRSADFQRAEYDTVMKADFVKPGLVAIEGLKQNYWKTLPDVQPRQWENDGSFDPAELQISMGQLADGSTVSNYFYSSKTPDLHFTDVTMLNGEGLYHAVFVMADAEGYEPIKYEIDLRVIGHQPYNSLGGSVEGRVLLMNNDLGEEGKRDAVTYQNWAFNLRSLPASVNYPTFWECFGDDALAETSSGYNRQAGTNWVLWTQNRGRRLWHLDNCRHGNTFKYQDTTAAGSAPEMATTQNYLPWSTTSVRITDSDRSRKARAFEVGQVLMRNVDDAAVYSPCYTNGVGTIYFDAVNGWVTGVDQNGYQIVVEVATETKTGEPLTDDTSANPDDPDDVYGNIKEWVPFKMYPVRIEGSSVTPPTEGVYTNNLGITDGGHLDRFYRIYVPVNLQTARFRIRRVSSTTSGSLLIPDTRLILIDNIFVSYPAMGADLSPLGDWDREKKGPQTLGWELATTVPFPHAGATNCHARAAVEYHKNSGLAGAEPSTFVSAAQMHYRWRYLNQSFTEWRSADLDPMNGFVSYQPLDLPSSVGDVEFWFETQLQAPFFSYADYSGLNIGMPCYKEEIVVVTNRCTLGETLPSSGTDWFFRLRNGESDWEALDVTISGGTLLDGAYPMSLIEDGMWRALVPLPTNATGTCTFSISGHNRTANGATSLPDATVVWGGQNVSTNEVPCDGRLVELTEGGGEQSFEIDHNANYIEFKASTKFGTWSVTRAEYQNFNNWNDIYTAPAVNPEFKATNPTNGVDDITMNKYELDASKWKIFANANDAWNEPFYLANYSDPGFPKEQMFQTHKTPNDWNANFVTFVSTELKANTTAEQAKSGIAGKIRGAGMGSIEFVKSSRPAGLNEVKVSARLGQSMSDLGAFSFASEALFKTNYTFVAPATMSRNTAENGTAAGDMTVGASASVVAYYRPYKGCYEFRVERLFASQKSGSTYSMTLRLSLYKWSYRGGAVSPTCLYTRDFTDSKMIMWSEKKTVGSTTVPKNDYYAMLISVDSSQSGKTRIVCGLSTAKEPEGAEGDSIGPSTYLAGNLDYVGFAWEDKEAGRLTEGAYGVGSKDCPAEFIMPFHHDLPIEKMLQTQISTWADTANKVGYYTKFKLKIGGANWSTHDRDDICKGRWELAPLRAEVYTNTAHSATWRGLKAPTTLAQTLQLYLQPANGGAWQLFGEKAVAGYNFSDYTFPLHLSGQWNMRIQTGPANVDVAIKSIVQSQWQAPDHEDLAYKDKDFVYTQGLVGTNTVAKRNEITLQPSRGSITKPFSVRGPLLNGLGKVSFSYSGADANAAIWVQMATNNVANSLNGTYGYNLSVESVEPGKKGADNAWITVKKYGAGGEEALDASGTKTVFLGLHNQKEAPVEGMFRLFVPTSVVQRAGIVATNDQQNVDYGKITITGMSVTDEPGLSDRNWIGYNLRGIGDATDVERRMFLTDTTLPGKTGNGLDCALNNSLNGINPDDIDRARATYPSVISPTFKSENGVKNGVGTVSFKARLWSTNNVPETMAAGRIVIYGSNNSMSGDWHPLQTNYVMSSVFSDFTWETKRETYQAIKLEISDAAIKGTGDALIPRVDRVIIDEVVVGEKVQPTLTFAYVRPFRQNLLRAEPIEDILSPDEQPLAGESWGVQTQLQLKQLTDEIDTDRGFEVYFTHFTGNSPWGYANWKNEGSRPVKLVQVGDPADLIFRSVGDTPESLVEPVTLGGTVVQFQITVKYWNRNGQEFTSELETKNDWKQPDWYWPVDLNEEKGGYQNREKFSAYTLLDTVSPGRAWINEVNFNDGDGPENGTGYEPPVNQQFIELCVPSGVDMTGWMLVVTDVNTNQMLMAVFGNGAGRIPAVKQPTPNEKNGFEFVVVGSPATEAAGPLRDGEGNAVTLDGVWSSGSVGGTVTSGSLAYNRPFQFELIRPTRVVEHQIVVGGTNTVRQTASYRYTYDATNLLARLDEAVPSPHRFIAVTNELSRLDDRTRYASAGVVTGAVGVAGLEPGGPNTWSPKLTFTPGRANITQDGVNQYIPEDWFIAPNGTNAWVTLRIVGDHLHQDCGGETNPVMRIVVPQGSTTNICYTADPWYELAALSVDGVTVTSHVARKTAEFRYELMPTSKFCEVTAEAGCDSGLADRIDMDGPYAPAIVEWLADRWPTRSAEEIRPAWQMEHGSTNSYEMPLLEMYFLDIPPFAETAAEETAEKLWWFRHGITDARFNAYVITNYYQAGEMYYTNTQVDVKLYISNSVTTEAYAPYHLQGLGYTKSDDEGLVGPWRGPTFQLQAQLNNGITNQWNQFNTFRSFVFDGGSFTSAEDKKPFTSTIEMLDPFTEEGSLGYGWTVWPRSTGFFLRTVGSTNTVPYSVDVLKADDTYEYLRQLPPRGQ